MNVHQPAAAFTAVPTDLHAVPNSRSRGIKGNATSGIATPAPGTVGTHQTTTRTVDVKGDNSRSADARGDDVSITQTSTRVTTRINGELLG
jgi:hypothetical protein